MREGEDHRGHRHEVRKLFPPGWSRLGAGVWPESGYAATGLWEAAARGRVRDDTRSVSVLADVRTQPASIPALNSRRGRQDMPRSTSIRFSDLGKNLGFYFLFNED